MTNHLKKNIPKYYVAKPYVSYQSPMILTTAKHWQYEGMKWWKYIDEFHWWKKNLFSLVIYDFSDHLFFLYNLQLCIIA